MSFCSDGHTIAIGASNSGAILVYDLRKSSKEVHKLCSGHTQTINSLNFANKMQVPKNSRSSGAVRESTTNVQNNQSDQKEETKQFKSMNQIKAEAKALAE